MRRGTRGPDLATQERRRQSCFFSAEVGKTEQAVSVAKGDVW